MGTEMRPRAVVEKWVERFNAADADGLAALYHQDAVNHQVANEPIEGKANIHAMFAREFATAKALVPSAAQPADRVVSERLRDGDERR